MTPLRASVLLALLAASGCAPTVSDYCRHVVTECEVKSTWSTEPACVDETERRLESWNKTEACKPMASRWHDLAGCVSLVACDDLKVMSPMFNGKCAREYGAMVDAAMAVGTACAF